MKTQNSIRESAVWALLGLLAVGACARPGPQPQEPAPADAPDGEEPQEETQPEAPPPPRRASDPSLEPRLALMVGFMPLTTTGVDAFLARHPEADGRGVLIGILDSGLDLDLPGMAVTTTGEPKVVGVRDFSREGRIPLQPVTVTGDTVTFAGQTLIGFGHVAASAAPPYYAGVFREQPLGKVPAGDLNGNDKNTDEFVVLVVKTASGWAVVTDADNDGRLDDETPIHDYSVAAERFIYSLQDEKRDEGLMTIAVNITEGDDAPVLDLFFDNRAHGSHVAGIATGHNMFDREGFNGVAPGAQLLAIKIANNARGGLSVTGSMLRAMNYAASFAQQRGMPLILNMSFGVGNDAEGEAAIDSMVTEFVLKHPDVLFVISAGNEGPGVSSVGFPGSADHILSVCALIPGAFAGPRPAGLATDADVVADFSARGGEVAKPDLCAPGVAFSNVPRWNLGGEISGGTSMAAPHIAGLAALLQSARLQANGVARATDLRQALMASARPHRGATFVDMGSGVPNVNRAHEWLAAGHQAGVYSIRAQPDGGNTSILDAAYRRNGLASPADTIQRFVVRSVAGQPAARFILESDERWLRAPETLELSGGPATVEVTYNPSRLRTPGLYVGTVYATPASDTLAGPAFRLVNTVIVPRTLDQPFVEGRDLGPGRLRRYFFDVPADAGGLTVEMEMRYRTQRGSLFLFEPGGQPFRDGSDEEAGPGDHVVRIEVRGEDLVPGVYEAVVVSPENSALSYDIRAALPRYTVDQVGTGPSAVIRKRSNVPPLIQDAAVFQRSDSGGNSTDDVLVTAADIGAVKTVMVSGERDDPKFLPVEVPGWVREVIVDVQLPVGAWNQYTDFGVTLFEPSGEQIDHGPLSFGFGRHEFELSGRHRGKTLQLELFPAFAHLEPPATWDAEVTVYLIAGAPTALAAAGANTSAIVLAPGDVTGIQFIPPEGRATPAGFVPLIEVVANPAGGAPARRWGRLD
jgi:subtilisin family serine protease